MSHRILLGKYYRWQIQYQEIFRIEKKGVVNEKDGIKHDMACSNENYDQCIDNVLFNLMKENTLDNCTVPWVHRNENICTIDEDINTTFSIWWNRVTNQKNDCYMPCHTLLLDVSPSADETNHDGDDFGKVTVFFSSRTIKNEEHYLYSYIKVVAEVGAYLGLYRLVLWALTLCRFHNLIKEQHSKYKSSSKSKDNVDVHAIT